MKPPYFIFLFFGVIIITAGSLFQLRPPILPFILGLVISDGVMGLFHRFIWHSQHPWLRYIAEAHAVHHKEPNNVRIDAQDILAYANGTLLLCAAVWLGLGVGICCGFGAYYPLAMLVHDEIGHGRASGRGSGWSFSLHTSLHHAEPKRHFTVVHLECSNLI